MYIFDENPDDIMQISKTCNTNSLNDFSYCNDSGLKMSQSSSFQGIEFEQIFDSRHRHLRAFEIGFTAAEP